MTRVYYHFDKQHSYNKPSKVVLKKLCDLKKFLEKTLQENNIAISDIVIRIDNSNDSLTVIKTTKLLHDLQLDIIDD